MFSSYNMDTPIFYYTLLSIYSHFPNDGYFEKKVNKIKVFNDYKTYFFQQKQKTTSNNVFQWFMILSSIQSAFRI